MSEPVTKESILKTCERVAKRGDMLAVHRFKYSRSELRKLCAALCNEGKLKRHGVANPMIYYYRPEDVAVIAKAQMRHEEEMKRIHARNVEWHLAQAEKHPELSDYHHKQAEEERRLSA